MNKEEILQKLAAGELSVDEAGRLLAQIEHPAQSLIYQTAQHMYCQTQA
jgi:hypothetical protein